MSILEAIKTYMLTFPLLKDDALFLSDHSSGDIVQYSIIQIPGTRVLEEDLLGNESCQYTFAFQSIESTMDELARFANASFYDELETWLKSQSAQNILPAMESSQHPEKIETLSWGYLMQEQTGTGVYQVQCRLLYTQDP
jgi:hypothetical protein